MITVERLDNDRLALRGGSELYLHRSVIKSIPGMEFNFTTKRWEGFYDAVGVVLGRLKSMGLSVGTLPPRDLITPGIRLKLDHLLPHQRDGVVFLLAHSQFGAILADDVGCMKTAQALTAARILDERTIVVCPLSVKDHWVREAERWWPDCQLGVVIGTDPTDPAIGDRIHPDSRLIIINYDILYAHSELLEDLNPQTVIFDECQYLTGQHSRRSGAAKKLAGQLQYRMALSATPMHDHPKDLWGIMDVISPGRFGKKFFSFGIRYCGGKQVTIRETPHLSDDRLTEDQPTVVWNFDGSSNLPELQQRLRVVCLRRTKEEAGLELPSRVREIVDLDLGSSQGNSKGGIQAALRSDGKLRQALGNAGEAKIPSVIKLLREKITEGQKVVVWTYRKNLCHKLADRLIMMGVDTRLVDGSIPIKKRLSVIGDRPDVLVATMDSIGTGVDLSYSSVGIFVELDWTPQLMVQCEGRQHRPGQENPCYFYYLVARGTIDEVIRSAMLVKLTNFSQSVGGLDDGLEESLRGSNRLSQREKLQKIYQMLSTS